MDANELPTDVEELKALLLSTLASKEQELQRVHSRATQFVQQAIELSATVTAQEKQLAAREKTIKELLAALRGKTRERIDPDQMLLFEIGELEKLNEESLAREKATSCDKNRRKMNRSPRLIPDNIHVEIAEHALPEEQRRCKIDGQVMARMRWEESTQLDYVPAQIKKIIREFFGKAVKFELSEKNPFAGFEIASDVNIDRHVFIDRQTIKHMIDTATDVRWRCLLGFAGLCGLRTRSEIAAIQWEHIHWDANTFSVPSVKTKERTVPLFGDFREYLEACHRQVIGPDC